MIIHESIENIDKNIVFFFLLLSIISQHVFVWNIFWYIDWIFFFMFINKNVNVDGYIYIYIFPILWTSLTLTGNSMSLKSGFFAKFSSASVILLLYFPGFKFLTKHHLKHSLSLMFWILINPFLGWINYFAEFL